MTRQWIQLLGGFLFMRIFLHKLRGHDFPRQIDEYVAWKKLFASSTDNYKSGLRAFFLFCGRDDISLVSKEDVNDYFRYLELKSTPFTAKRRLGTLRDFFRYFGARKVVCLDWKRISDQGISTTLPTHDILRNMSKKIDWTERVTRNKELVGKRLEDPLKWTWGQLGAYFHIERVTAKQMFDRHVLKYATDKEYKRYQAIIDKTYSF